MYITTPPSYLIRNRLSVVNVTPVTALMCPERTVEHLAQTRTKQTIAVHSDVVQQQHATRTMLGYVTI